jgi:hypothetical protein
MRRRSSFVMKYPCWQASWHASIRLPHLGHSLRETRGRRRWSVGRFLKRVFKLGVLAGAGYAVWRYFDSRRSESAVSWEPQPVPFPPKPRVEPAPTTGAVAVEETAVEETAVEETAVEIPPAEPAPASANGAWVEPVAGTCPEGYPVKAKMGSGIYHVKGGLSYGRTTPDRCYRDAESAEADGLRPAKR